MFFKHGEPERYINWLFNAVGWQKISMMIFCVVLIRPVFAENPFDDNKNPWPEIHSQRIQKLLPVAMKRANVESWVVFCRENDNDPLAQHVGGENAGGTAAFLFLLNDDIVHSVAVSPRGEATALGDMGLHGEVIIISRGNNVWKIVADKLQEADPDRIAVNTSQKNIADGLSYTQRMKLEEALGAEMRQRLVSSEELVIEWLSVKLPQEVEIMRRAARLTAEWQLEAYATVVPGKTRDSDLAQFLKKRMDEYGVEDAWAPEQNPNVNSGVDRGHSHATDKIIQPGDFIQIDFGIKVFGIWCTDIQRFAYVLHPGESEASTSALDKWRKARKGNRIALAAMKPGVHGYDVDKAQRDWLSENGSLPVMWGTGHPVGYWAHDAGPSLSGAQGGRQPSGNNRRILRPGQTFAFDGFFSWLLDPSDPESVKTISVEEMAVVTNEGAQYLIQPQENLILIRTEKKVN